ncbi:hypothetical protein FPS98_09150 [Brevibacillus brevis]|uniref:Uncharacterized protein n=1 Tax=Brevibacillus brevis TaxID=1393 RepID=A0A517I5F5_BREBE|nr:2Fe-2S iron-sulfur cluster-binding protein [Brevibacillus brevis]QDS34131.1 hypothetical protein FPS98_09150 [Brevibacillus brevis]
MKKISFELNGVKHEAEEGTRILDYLLQQEIEHPHICYSPITCGVFTACLLMEWNLNRMKISCLCTK